MFRVEFLLALLVFASFSSSVWLVFKKPAQSHQLGRAILFTSAIVSKSALLYGIWRADLTGSGRALLQFSFGVGGLIASYLLFLWASFVVRKSPPTVVFGTHESKILFSTGPYRWVRHPFYFSYIIGYWSAFLLCDSWLFGMFPILMTSVYYWAAKREEKIILASEKGSEYQDYRNEVGMFFKKWKSRKV